MTLNVGVIGVGMIGQDHIRRLTHVLSGARVTAVTDVDLDRAKSVAAGLPAAKALQTGQELIADSEVDAVVVASWGPTHEEYVLACIEAGKQVFCEKPLATTREACERILDAEVAAGKRLVMVGFMRRYDDAYRAMKAALNDGQIGAPLLYYSGHRNPSVPPSVTTDGVLVDTCVHDIDTSRWLFDAEVVSAEVRSPRRSSLAAEHLQDPILLLLELSNGMLVEHRGRGEHRLRLRHPRRGARRDGHDRAGRERPDRRQARGRVRRPGAERLARAVHPRLRHRVPGVDRRGRGRTLHRPELVGRLRGHRRVRRRGRGEPDGPEGAGADARAARPLPRRRRPTGTD